MNLKSVIAILSVAALATVSFGQGMRGGAMGNPAAMPQILLQREDVRTELQLTDEQKSKLFDMQSGIRQRFTEAARQPYDDDKARRKAFENIGKKIIEEVNAILTPGQLTRLKEVAIQVAGFSSAVVPDIQKSLSITDSQKNKITDLTTRQDAATAAAWQKLRDGEIQFADVQDTTKKNQKILNDEIGKILTPAQKDKLKTLGGKTFVPAPDPAAGGTV
jgi:Spy/CpxP family protein refolding chaperone